MHARYDFPSPWWDEISQDAKKLVSALLPDMEQLGLWNGKLSEAEVQQPPPPAPATAADGTPPVPGDDQDWEFEDDLE